MSVRLLEWGLLIGNSLQTRTEDAQTSMQKILNICYWMHETIKNLKEKEVEIISVLYVLKGIIRRFLNDLYLIGETSYMKRRPAFSCYI